MQGAAIVPHDEIVNPPSMRMNELPLCGVSEQFVDQSAAFFSLFLPSLNIGNYRFPCEPTAAR
jgi:hypothetical protein